MAGAEKPTAYRFGLDEELVADVRALAKTVAEGSAVVDRASVTREGASADFLRTTLTVTLLERKGDK